MRTFTTLLALATVLTLHAQTALYLNINSHNEETDFEGIGGNSSGSENSSYGYNNDSLKFATYRNYVKQAADTIVQKNVKWNFQTDWTFLEGAMNFDHGNLSSNTGGQNIFQFLQNSTGGRVQIDPHAHASTHNMADICWMLTQYGITPSNNVGGFLYDTLMGTMQGSDWRLDGNGIQTEYFPFASTGYTWTPNVLWGAGSANHTNDLNDYGAWKPVYMDLQLPNDSFYTHDPSQPLLYIGNGCSGKIPDNALNISQANSQVNQIVSTLTSFADNINNGTYPPNKFYTASIQVDVRSLGNPFFLYKLGKVIDALNAYNQTHPGYIVWQTLGEKRTTWNTTFNQNNNQRDCSGNMITAPPPPSSTGIAEQTAQETEVYPNPAAGQFTISAIPANAGNVAIYVYDASGKLLREMSSLNATSIEISTATLPAGIYLVRGTDAGGRLLFSKREQIIN